MNGFELSPCELLHPFQEYLSRLHGLLIHNVKCLKQLVVLSLFNLIALAPLFALNVIVEYK